MVSVPRAAFFDISATMLDWSCGNCWRVKFANPLLISSIKCWCTSMDSNHHCADFKSAASAGWATRAKMVGAPRFELGRPQGPTILQTAAAMPYLPDTRTLAEAERLERSRPVHIWTYL